MQHNGTRTRLVAGVVALAVLCAVGTAVATIGGLTSDDLGADTRDVGSCDSDGIDFDYNNGFDEVAGEYVVDRVTMSDIAFECLRRPYEVSFLQEGRGGPLVLHGADGLDFEIYNRSTNGGFDPVGRLDVEVRFPAEDLDGIAMYIGGLQPGP